MHAGTGVGSALNQTGAGIGAGIARGGEAVGSAVNRTGAAGREAAIAAANLTEGVLIGSKDAIAAFLNGTANTVTGEVCNQVQTRDQVSDLLYGSSKKQDACTSLQMEVS